MRSTRARWRDAGLLLAAIGLTLGQAPVPPAATPAAPTAERVAFDAWLDAQVARALDARAEAVARLTTADAVRARQQDVRAALAASIGTLPVSDAPLNATVTGTLRRDGYRIEKLHFESQPGYRVTALAYVPDGPGPFPAVLGTAGHSDEGKAFSTYQHAWISLARRGFLVLAYDPAGQGERVEYLDERTGTSRVGVGVPEHIMTGQQLMLTGSSMAAWTVQDGRRAVDYLLTRRDVDPARIAVAGNSGGGTQAALLTAFEPRLAAAVVSCYTTSWRDLWRGAGPQDAEQILPGFLSRGLDFADFATAYAPHGYLVSAAVRDYFPIAGARAAYAELQKTYALIGAEERVAMVEHDAQHGWAKELREGAYRSLARWLSGPQAPEAEAPLTPDDPKELQVTPTGQLASSIGSRTTRALNYERAATLARTRGAASDAAIREIVQLESRPTSARIVGREPLPGGGAERVFVEVEPGVRLAGTLHRPSSQPARGVALVVDDRGTASSTAVAALAREGHVVLALDVRGTGALAPLTGASGYSASYQFAARAWLLGTSVVAWQARDILAGLDVLRAEAPGAATRVVYAHGQTAPAALFAAQVERPSRLVLDGGPSSYLDLAAADTYPDAALTIVPGVLTVTDLPELAARLEPTTKVERTR